MAERKPQGAADFIGKIVKDPKNPPATIVLTGFLGASSEDGHTRLYFDAALSSYVEIPNDAILHTQPAAEGGLGASYVWVKRDAVLVYGPAGAQRPRGTFLQGPIMQDHLGGAAAVNHVEQLAAQTAGAGVFCSAACPTPQQPPSIFSPCPTPQQPPTMALYCTSIQPRFCMPPTADCPTPACQTQFCPTMRLEFCQTMYGCPTQIACQR